ncbi:MAG: putative lipid II flippase FtsW [Candidatus Komeilibacteria bacterium]|nr:putative lipid II flippase FtsW [Candidatus Komeilibacteria bacterium]
MIRKRKFSEYLKHLLKLPFSYQSRHHAPDYVFLGALALIIVIGLMMLSSASSVTGFKEHGDSYYFFKHQLLVGFLPGLILFFWAAQMDFRTWKKKAFLMLIVCVVILLAVFIPGLGKNYGKTQSWLKLGPISFQPAETVKLFFLVYLATWLEKRGERNLQDLKYGLIPFLTSLGIISTLILAQPDIGTLIIILASCLTVYFIAKAPYRHLLLIGAGVLVIFFLAVQIAPYRLARITAFLNSDVDPQGISYHITQAKIAVGSGGILGLGIGKSRQKFDYLPEVYGDSIFAVIAEEMGFIFCVILLALFLTVAIRGFKIARAAPDNFSQFLTVGIISWFIFEAFINIAAMIGLFPITGIPLPFISYGGTALAISLLGVGIVTNISKQTKPY